MRGIFCTTVIAVVLAIILFAAMDISLATPVAAIGLLTDDYGFDCSGLTIGEAVLLIDKITQCRVMEKNEEAEQYKRSLMQKLKDAGLNRNIEAYCMLQLGEMRFQKPEIYLSYGELAAYFSNSVKTINPPYTQMISIEETRLVRCEKYFQTIIILSVDISDFLQKLSITSARVSELFFYAEIQTYIDNLGKIHCLELLLSPMNADIDAKLISYALSEIFGSKDYERIIFFLYETIVYNLGFVGQGGEAGELGVGEHGITFITRTE